MADIFAILACSGGLAAWAWWLKRAAVRELLAKPFRVIASEVVEHQVCKVCGRMVARYDENGICANCEAEGRS